MTRAETTAGTFRTGHLRLPPAEAVQRSVPVGHPEGSGEARSVPVGPKGSSDSRWRGGGNDLESQIVVDGEDMADPGRQRIRPRRPRQPSEIEPSAQCCVSIWPAIYSESS